MHSYNELIKAQDIMKSQKEIYQPTSFWAKASNEISEEIQKYGIENLKTVINLILSEKKYLVWQKIKFEIKHTEAAKNIVSSILKQSSSL